MKRPVAQSASRVLVVKLGPDVAAQYNATMNCVFSAQRHGTVVDALVLSPRPSVLMQQAARLTTGTLIHLHETHRDQLATSPAASLFETGGPAASDAERSPRVGTSSPSSRRRSRAGRT